MKKVLILACAALTACTNDIDLGPNKEQVETLSNAIGFQMAKKNMTTTKATQTLQSQGHYNFGVWGYKAHTGVGEPLIMENYLVGYMDETSNKGYFMTSANQTTLGDPSNSAKGTSMWAYENLGSSDYTYADSEGYYKKDQTEYMSNNANQYLRYWDLSSDRTTFYAYAPYVNKTASSTAGVTFDNISKTMSFPNGSIVMGKDQPADQEFMYAVKKVEKINYTEDVKLVFHRMGARIQIKFWEDIPGYTVTMKKLSTNSVTSPSTLTEGIYAKPAIAPASGNTYREGKYLTKTGADIVFINDETTATAPTANVTFKGVTNISSDCLTFDIPTEQLGENRGEAKPSKTKYYMIPRGATFNPAIGTTDDLKKTGFIFHVSYELTNNQTNEKIIVTDARVYVPAANCEWAPNKSYTYIFKITKSSNGTTEKKDPNPEDMNVPTEQSLFPIVFDGCTVEDYETEIENDYTISDANAPVYTLSLNASSVAKNGTITGTANAASSTSTTAPASSAITVEKVTATGDPNKINVTVNAGTTNNISISAAADAPAGTYKLVYKNASDEVVATVTFTVTD